MSEMSYISVIERYHEYQNAIEELLLSIVTGISDQRLFKDPSQLPQAIRDVSAHYPFVDMMFTLDNEGIQTSSNITTEGKPLPDRPAKGVDRSQRPYFKLAKECNGPAVSQPYLSSVNRNLCISAIMPCGASDESCGYLVVDIDLREIIEFLMGDTLRGHFHPVFRSVYSIISLGLFAVVAALLYQAFSEIIHLFSDVNSEQIYLKPFSVIIHLTLALAIFDLGKTTLEEEVLMHKDIFRHSSTRRTITRFIGAILIAVSIEGLLMMFKSALGGGDDMLSAVWMMFAAIGLLIALGIYVYLGAKAETALKGMYQRRDKIWQSDDQ